MSSEERLLGLSRELSMMVFTSHRLLQSQTSSKDLLASPKLRPQIAAKKTTEDHPAKLRNWMKTSGIRKGGKGGGRKKMIVSSTPKSPPVRSLRISCSLDCFEHADDKSSSLSVFSLPPPLLSSSKKTSAECASTYSTASTKASLASCRPTEAELDFRAGDHVQLSWAMLKARGVEAYKDKLPAVILYEMVEHDPNHAREALSLTKYNKEHMIKLCKQVYSMTDAMVAAFVGTDLEPLVELAERYAGGSAHLRRECLSDIERDPGGGFYIRYGRGLDNASWVH